MKILIQFPDKKTEELALGKLNPRFPGEIWATGETAVPGPALTFLAEAGIKFTVLGPATRNSLRDIQPASVGAILRPYPSKDDDLMEEMLDNGK
jgi:hypothetical protein